MRGTSSGRLALSETAEEREARMQRLTDRLASETAEERVARLQQISRLTSMRDWYPRLPRIERTAKLQPMSANQHERLVSETAEQRKARLHSFEGLTGNSTPRAISPAPSPPCSQLVLPTLYYPSCRRIDYQTDSMPTVDMYSICHSLLRQLLALTAQ